MFKIRLIESFTWLFMEVEKMIMDGVGADILDKKVYDKFSDSEYYPVLCYLCDVAYTENINRNEKIDFEEILYCLINLCQRDKANLNIKVMKEYTENNILRLIEATVRLIQLLKVLE